MSLTPEKRQSIDAIFRAKGYTDYQWIGPPENHRGPVGAPQMPVRVSHRCAHCV